MTDPNIPDEELLGYLDDPSLERGHLDDSTAHRLAIFESTSDALRTTSLEVSAVRRDAAVNAALGAYDLAGAAEGSSTDSSNQVVLDLQRRRLRRANRFMFGAAAAGVLLFGGVVTTTAVTNKANDASSMIASDAVSPAQTNSISESADSPTAGRSATSTAPSIAAEDLATAGVPDSAVGLAFLGDISTATQQIDATRIATENAAFIEPTDNAAAGWDPFFCPDEAVGALGTSAIALGSVNVEGDPGVMWVTTASTPALFAVYAIGSCAELAIGNLGS
jgi:hypothetical protein